MDSAISPVPAAGRSFGHEADPQSALPAPGTPEPAPAPLRLRPAAPAQTGPEPVDEEEAARRTAEALQEEVDSLSALRVRFGYDEETSRYVVEFFDPEKEEIVRQIPPENLLTSIKRLREIRGVLFDGKS